MKRDKSNYWALAIIAGASLCLFLMWSKIEYPRNWDWKVLMTTVLYGFAAGASFAHMADSYQKSIVVFFDLVWVGLASLGITLAGWNYLHRAAVDKKDHATWMAQQSNGDLSLRAGLLSEQPCASNPQTFRGEFKTALSQLAKVPDSRALSDTSRAMLREAQGKTECERVLLEQVQQAIARTEAYELDRTEAADAARASGVPAWMVLFGPAILAFALGLRLVKGAVDLKDALKPKAKSP